MDNKNKATYQIGNCFYTGIVLVDGKIACEQCKTIEPELKHTLHMDYTDNFTNLYQCNKCGNSITLEIKRTGIDKKYWQGEMD